MHPIPCMLPNALDFLFLMKVMNSENDILYRASFMTIETLPLSSFKLQSGTLQNKLSHLKKNL